VWPEKERNNNQLCEGENKNFVQHAGAIQQMVTHVAHPEKLKSNNSVWQK